ncbi:hypothetical protein WJX73_002390 [Symbiochloris irregularis]|uniref:Uncharacterized protein n=1 Tax=Symbiochloris irregularis TaxID=706552 RepID=A0AAW1P2H8_9CHLO
MSPTTTADSRYLAVLRSKNLLAARDSAERRVTISDTVLCRDEPAPTAADAASVLELISPVCRWLASRSNGISLLDVQFECCVFPEHDQPCLDRRKFVPVFLAGLRDLPLEISLSFYCQSREELFLLGSHTLTSDLAASLVSLTLHCRVRSSGFLALTQLSRLRKIVQPAVFGIAGPGFDR